MEESIRQAILEQHKVPYGDIAPQEWAKVILDLMAHFKPILPYLHLGQTIGEQVSSAHLLTLAGKLTQKTHCTEVTWTDFHPSRDIQRTLYITELGLAWRYVHADAVTFEPADADSLAKLFREKSLSPTNTIETLMRLVGSEIKLREQRLVSLLAADEALKGLIARLTYWPSLAS